MSQYKPISERRAKAGPAGAQTSAGPAKPERKPKYIPNAGLLAQTASTFIIDGEDFDDFNKYRKAYFERFGPRDLVEADLLDDIVHSGWTRRRTWRMENELVNLQMQRMEGAVAAEMEPVTHGRRAALAAEALAEKRALPLLHRYAARLSSDYRHSMKAFSQLRAEVLLVPPGRLPEPDADLAAPPVVPAQPEECKQLAPEPETSPGHCETGPCPETNTSETPESTESQVPAAAPQPPRITVRHEPPTPNRVSLLDFNPPALQHRRPDKL